MDRNDPDGILVFCGPVALRKESVDRNVRLLMFFWQCGRVALRKESVDRNHPKSGIVVHPLVALRKESVDRNCPTCQWRRSVKLSLSARRAWIEMLAPRLVDMSDAVALRKESVDRNKYVVQCRKVLGGRSPQGERG